MNNNYNQSINEYIKSVNRILPYPKEKKKEALEVLRSDVESAINDSDNKNPVEVFGNPTEVAKSVVEGQEWHTDRAGWGIRFIAWGIDLFLKIGLGFLVVGIGFVFLLFFMPFDELMQEFMKWETANLLDDLIGTSNGLLTFIISFISISLGASCFFLYNIVLEYKFSTTIGKRLFHLVAVDQTGIKMVGRQVVIRNLSKIVLGEFLFVDMFLGLVLEKQTPERTDKQRGLDILAETIVVRV